MQLLKKSSRKWLLIVVGIVVVLAVVAILVIPRLLPANNQVTSSVIASATATNGDISTTVTGSGTLAEASVDVTAPVGIKITDIYVHSGDAVAAGDVLAAVDADSVSTTIGLVDEEKTALVEASSALGGSTTIDRMIVAYDKVMVELNKISASGYISAGSSGKVGSVNLKKGDTVAVSTGSGSSGNTDASANGSNATPASFSASESLASKGGLWTADYQYPADYNSYNSYASDIPTDKAAYTQTSNNSGDILNPIEDGSAAAFKVSALPYATATVSKARAACAATAVVTKEEATKAFLIELAEAKGSTTTDPQVPITLTVNPGQFKTEKGVYAVTFSALDDPTATATTYVVLEDDTSDSNGQNGLPSGSNGDAPGTSTGANSNASGPASDSVGQSGSNSAGSGAGTSAGTGTGSTSAEQAVIDSAMAPIISILSDDKMEVQLELDELDVAAVKVDQQATVELSALEGQKFEGVVSSAYSSSGTYYAMITVSKSEGMYAGFSATAAIVKEEVVNVTTIPLDAVQQQGNELFVYTSTTEGGELGGRTAIQTGLSDGSTVEVTSGLSAGTTIYYQQQITSGAASTSTSATGRGPTIITENFGGGGGGPMQSFNGSTAGARPMGPDSRQP